MMLSELFSDLNGTKAAFTSAWQDLTRYLEQGLDGLVEPPYHVSHALQINPQLDVSLTIKLCRHETAPGQHTATATTLRERSFYNLNYAGSLPFGEAYRIFFGRDLKLSETPRGPLPLHVVLTPDDPDCARRILHRWISEGMEADRAGSAPPAGPRSWLAADNPELPKRHRLRGP
ncbi:MAG: hypothetical protein NDJ24_01600 [Alphaproteobacteria bacterium]|nr:hypothetical protein [Alphaproteobacteria bacterium]